jgi:hypothetical protein
VSGSKIELSQARGSKMEATNPRMQSPETNDE